MTALDKQALEKVKDAMARLEAENCYTVVFSGSPRKLDSNPFKIESAFGRVIAIGYGNAFDAKEEVENLLNEIGDIVGR